MGPAHYPLLKIYFFIVDSIVDISHPPSPFTPHHLVPAYPTQPPRSSLPHYRFHSYAYTFSFSSLSQDIQSFLGFRTLQEGQCICCKSQSIIVWDSSEEFRLQKVDRFLQIKIRLERKKNTYFTIQNNPKEYFQAFIQKIISASTKHLTFVLGSGNQ